MVDWVLREFSTIETKRLKAHRVKEVAKSRYKGGFLNVALI